jgi:thiol-disulfide isomerase/thioredoxin
VLILVGCGMHQPNGMFIDFSGLNKASKLKIVLSEFRFDNGTTSWNWVKVDSIYIEKGSITSLLEWPKKYDHKFIANLNIYNVKGLIIGSSKEFIYSQAHLIAKKNLLSKPINIAERYENAITMDITGGENTLYANQDFLSHPNIHLAGAFISKIKNTKNLKKDTTLINEKWNAYENNVIKQVDTYHDYYFTLFKLLSVCDYLSNETLEKCLSKISPDLRNTNEWRFLNTYLHNSNKLIIGSKIPPFQLNTGKTNQSQSSLLNGGKYYFIDFWASWCMPCRQQMQNLKLIYPKIDTTKIQFVSLSTDVNKQNWVVASKAENLKWPSYLQSDTGDNNLLVLFALRYIPQNILIDSKGTIINKNLSENELNTFLSKYKL